MNNSGDTAHDQSTQQLIDARTVFLGVEASTREDLFDLVIQVAQEQGITNNPQGLLADLIAREEQMGTGLMDGFAIPHAKSRHVIRVSVLFIRTAHPLAWNMMEGNNASNFFVLLVPEKNEGNVHLAMISALAVALLEDDFKKAVASCADAGQLVELINSNVEL